MNILVFIWAVKKNLLWFNFVCDVSFFSYSSTKVPHSSGESTSSWYKQESVSLTKKIKVKTIYVSLNDWNEPVNWLKDIKEKSQTPVPAKSRIKVFELISLILHWSRQIILTEIHVPSFVPEKNVNVLSLNNLFFKSQIFKSPTVRL